MKDNKKNKISNYVNALSQYFEYDVKKLDAFYSELSNLLDLYSLNEIENFFESRSLPKLYKKQIWEQISKEFKLSQYIINFVFVLIENSSTYLLSDIASGLQKKIYDIKKIKFVNIQLHREFDSGELNKISESIKKLLPFESEVFFSVNPDILSGLTISWDSFMLDLSIRNKINNLLRTLELE